VYFQYQYIDNSFTVLTPGAECLDGEGDAKRKLAELGHCVTRGALESPMRPIDLVVKGFPAVRNTADMAVTFGLHSEPGVVNSVSYNQEDKLLTVQVVPPQYTADSGWDNAGWIISESQLLLLSDPTVVALFHTVYLRPLAVQSAAFKAQYSFVDLTFNQPTNGGTAGSRIVCSRLIDEPDLELMGHFPPGVSDDCIWQSASVLRILYKPLPSQGKVLAPGDSLHVLGGQLQDDGNHLGEVRLADQMVTVLSDNYAAAPEASLIGVTSVGFCEPLALDASRSKGTRLSYRWRCLNDDDLNALLKTISGPTMSIPSSILSKTDFSFQIAVSATDFAGITSEQRVATVYRSSGPLPTILIDSDAEMFVESGVGVTLSGRAEFSSCSEASQMEFKWFGGQDGVDLAELGTKAIIPGVSGSGEVSDQYAIGGRTMYIYPQVLTPGQSYTFKLTGAPVGEPWNTGSASVVVHVLLPALVADIVGGSREVSNLRSVIVIDGSKSYDPSGIFQLKYDWSCVSRATNDICRHRTTRQVGGARTRHKFCVYCVCIASFYVVVAIIRPYSPLVKVLVFEDTPTLSITGGIQSGALHAGIYDLRLRVTDYKQLPSGSRKFGSRYASTSVSMTLFDLAIPDVGVNVNRAITTISEAGQINAGTKIVLTGVVAGYNAAATRQEETENVRIEARWEVSVSGVDSLDLANKDIAPLGNAKPARLCARLSLACLVSRVGLLVV
jgi:hypothetical protein